MARKSTKMSRMRNIEPAPLTFTLATTAVAAGASQRFYVDLSQCASIMARRFYRQGLNWGIAGIKVISLNPASVAIGKLPNTWVTSAAWNKAFTYWNRQLNDTLQEGGSESARARFSDFKVHADVQHVAAGVGANLLPYDLAGNVASPGEWDMSHIILPNVLPDASGTTIDPQEFLLHMVGQNNNGSLSRGVLEGYADSRAYPQSPDPVAPNVASNQNWLNRMFNDGNANPEILENAEFENNDLPYPQVDYPGGELQLPGLEWHDSVQIFSTSATTNVGITKAKGGNFPCGLIALDFNNKGENPANCLIQIDMIPGSHRGYLAEPMQEM